MAPTQKEQIEKLAAENSELKGQVAALTERLVKLEGCFEALSLNQTETVTRLEGVEDNLCQVTAEQLELQRDQADLAVRLEGQQMYSRKQTLLITGQAVELPTRGENVRQYVITLLKEHLGISNIEQRDICACHRLRNPKVILVRFASLDDADRVYRARTKPKKRGLLVFESLTSERLATIAVLRDLKQAGDNPVLSYFTQGGKIFVKTSENKDVRPTEIPFGASKDQIKDICNGKKVSISHVDIRDHIRLVHGTSNKLGADGKPEGRSGGPSGSNTNRQRVTRKKKTGAGGSAAGVQAAGTVSSEIPSIG